MPAPPFTSPNTDNYFIGKGNVYFKLVDADDSTYRHVGNCPKFEFTPKPEVKKHYSAMEGTKVLDRVATISVEAEVSITCEEFTPENLAVALGAVQQTDGSWDLLENSDVERAVKLVGTNDFGAKCQLILPRVFFTVSKAVSFIGEDWMNFDLVGEVLKHPLTAAGTTKVFTNLTFLASS